MQSQLPSLQNCDRGKRCNLLFSAISWVFWNLHIATYTDERFRVENQLDQLLESVKTTVLSINIKRSINRGLYIPWNSYLSVKPVSKNHKEHARYNSSDLYKELSNLYEVIDKLQSSSSKYGYIV